MADPAMSARSSVAMPTEISTASCRLIRSSSRLPRSRSLHVFESDPCEHLMNTLTDDGVVPFDERFGKARTSGQYDLAEHRDLRVRRVVGRGFHDDQAVENPQVLQHFRGAVSDEAVVVVQLAH